MDSMVPRQSRPVGTEASAHRVFGAGKVSQDAAGVGIKHHTLMGEGDLFANAVKQMYLQLPFQIVDLYGDCCLRITQLMRSFGEAFQLGYLQKGGYFSKFQDSSPLI